MRMPVLICLSFAILAVALAANNSTTKKKTRDVEKPSPENGEKNPDPDATMPSNATKTSKTPPAQKNSKKTSKKEDDDDDLGIIEDLEDLLKDDAEKNDDEIEIPSLNRITPDTDPISLGQKIKKIPDPKKRKELIAKLRNAWTENRRTFPGKFYQAAYASILNAEKASDFWDNQVKKAGKNASNKSNKLTKFDTNFFGKVDLGDAIGNARKLAEIDPVGIALRRGESVLLTVLSDASKNFGKITDMAFDTAGNVSNLIRAATPIVDDIPIASEIKNNVHNLFEEGIKRGKYLIRSCADNKSEALANAAKDAAKKADEKEELLRQFSFSSKRKL